MSSKPTIIQLGYRNKPNDRFIATYVNSTLVLGKEVHLISIVEIINSFHPARSSGTEIVQAFSRYFTRSTHQSTLTKFEDALKGCNTIIESAVKSLDSPINCAVMAIAGDDVYLSTLGNAKIFLRRDEKLNQVSARIQDIERNQFASVTNGELLPGDWLFMANEEFTSYLQKYEQELPNEALQLENNIKDFYAKYPETSFCGTLINIDNPKPFQITLFLDDEDKKIPISIPKFSLPIIELPKLNALKKFKIPFNKINLPKKLNLKIILPLIVIVIFAISLFMGKDNDKPKTNTVEVNNLAVAGANISNILKELSKENYANLKDAEREVVDSELTKANYSLINEENIYKQLDKPIKSLDVSDDLIALIDESDDLWTINNNNLVKVELSPKISGITSLTIIYNDLIILSTKDNSYYRAVPSQKVSQKAEIIPALANKQLILETYNNNLYAYNTTDNTVFRALNFNGDLKKLLPYTRSGVLKNNNVQSITINGDIISVSDNGSMEIFVRNINKLFVAKKDAISTNYVTSSIPKIFRSHDNIISSYDDKSLKEDKLKYIAFNGSKINNLNIHNNRLIFAIQNVLYEINL